jgi:hypothetical protein
MTTPTNLELVQQAFGYFGQQNIPAFIGMFSDDAVWTEPGDPADIPYAGSFTGPQGIMQLLGIIGHNLQMKKFVPTKFIADGDTVAVLGVNDSVVIATGNAYTTDWMYIFTVANGKFTNLQVLMDTLAIAKAFKPNAS